MLSLKGLSYHTASHWHLPSDLDILSTRADDSKVTAQGKKIQIKIEVLTQSRATF